MTAKDAMTVTPSTATPATCARRRERWLMDGFRESQEPERAPSLLLALVPLTVPPIPGRRHAQTHLARDAVALQAAAEQVREEGGSVKQAHLLVAEGGAKQHAAKHVLAPRRDDDGRRKRKAQADAVVLEVAVVDEDVGGVKQESRQYEELAPRPDLPAGRVAGTQQARGEECCREEGGHVRQHDSPAQQHLGAGSLVPARRAQCDSGGLERGDKLAVQPTLSAGVVWSRMRGSRLDMANFCNVTDRRARRAPPGVLGC